MATNRTYDQSAVGLQETNPSEVPASPTSSIERLEFESRGAAPQQPVPGDSQTGATLRDPGKSLLRDWLRNTQNPDPNEDRKGRWEKIGWEVFERKALLLAATRDLELNAVPNPMKLAATDIFVEKAQRTLSKRGLWLYIAGTFMALIAVGVLLTATWVVYHSDPNQLLGVKDSRAEVSAAYLTIVILKSTTMSGFIVGVVYFLVSLSRALLHEATVLYSRRHSLRFGRLFVYLMSDCMKREDLEAVFNWNAEFSTAFKDIRPEQVTKSLLARALDVPKQVAKTIAEATSYAARNSRPESKLSDD